MSESLHGANNTSDLYSAAASLYGFLLSPITLSPLSPACGGFAGLKPHAVFSPLLIVVIPPTSSC